jgi:hypothetical protein
MHEKIFKTSDSTRIQSNRINTLSIFQKPVCFDSGEGKKHVAMMCKVEEL